MVQRKAPNKTGIKTLHHKSETRLVNLKSTSSSSSSSSSQTHEKMKKITKKSRSIKRSVESLPPFKNNKPQQLRTDDQRSTATPQKQSPNYMKSTSSFEARKEQSPKTPTSKGSRNSKTNDQSSGVKGSRTSSLKKMRTLTKTRSFKPLRFPKKVISCEDFDAQKSTCSSILKESKYPNYLELDPGGTELDGSSAMKVCPYTYCSLNGHQHAPVPPLKCFLSARRRALKSQKGFKLGCLSPRQIKPSVSEFDIAEPVSAPEQDNSEFFVVDKDLECSEMDWKEGFKLGCLSPCQIKPNLTNVAEGIISAPEEENTQSFVGDQDLECSDMDWEEDYCSGSGLKLQEIDKDKIVKTSVEMLYDVESVSPGAWSEEDGDSASEGWCEQMKINQYGNYDAIEESDLNDELQGLTGDNNINYQKEETFQESKTVPDFAEKVKDEAEMNPTTIIYNIIQFNFSLFVNGEKIEHLETDKAVIVKTPAIQEQGMSNYEVNQKVTDDELPSTELMEFEKHGNPEQECNDSSESNTIDEEHAIISDVAGKVTSEMDHSFDRKSEPSANVRGCKKPRVEIGYDSLEFNPRGPNFLLETPDPDAETVDLRHQMMDERKNAEEWMVDFALQQAVTTLAPARSRKVALLVEAFEKVMPPDPVRSNRHISKAFTNSRPMQACS